MNSARMLAALALSAVASGAMAGEDKLRLAAGPGLDKVQQNCVSCHSLDYIPLNSPFLDQKGWEATVAKMAKAYGAPIKPEDAPVIAEYLAKHYGKR
jgi:sulfite dehydrogenase (cytochrome) subunit B